MEETASLRFGAMEGVNSSHCLLEDPNMINMLL